VNANEELRRLDPWLQRNKRTSWKPIVETQDGSVAASKFSGTPLLPDGAWPQCGACAAPLQFLLQLNLAQIPQELQSRFGAGILQFFFCVNDESACFANYYGDPFAVCQLLRLLPPSTREAASTVTSSPRKFPARKIVGWQPQDDYPSLPEHPELGLSYEHQPDVRGQRVQCPELSFDETLSFDDYYPYLDRCIDGDKLAGWPDWQQGVEYASCPKCRHRMESFVFQIDSEDNIPYMFGDGGRGQIIQCPEHKETLGFVWASG